MKNNKRQSIAIWRAGIGIGRRKERRKKLSDERVSVCIVIICRINCKMK